MIDECKEKYITQQKKTSWMMGVEKSNWEEKKIEETWRDGKKFWVMIAELLGNTKKRDEAAYVYTEEGIKKEIMTYTKEYMERWRREVYQKYEKTDFSFWHGDGTTEGARRKMERELLTENSGIMETPVIMEKDFVEVIKNMKNGKAAGTDGVPAELMKHLIKNENIRNFLI